MKRGEEVGDRKRIWKKEEIEVGRGGKETSDGGGAGRGGGGKQIRGGQGDTKGVEVKKVQKWGGNGKKQRGRKRKEM